MDSGLAAEIVSRVKHKLAENDHSILDEFQKAHDQLPKEYQERPVDYGDLLVLLGYLEVLCSYVGREIGSIELQRRLDKGEPGQYGSY